MADTAISLMDRIESEQPITNMVNARMQRIEELGRLRQEHMAARASVNPSDSASRHSRRDQLIRQTRQQRSTERRSFTNNIQRTPVRSISYENTNAAVNASAEPETGSFREMFENSRTNLFGPRVAGSTENLSTASLYGRVSSDAGLSVPRPIFQIGSESGSGSNTPRSSMRPPLDLSTGLAEAFAASRASRYGSDTRLNVREPRSLSVTRDSSSSVVPSTADSNVLTRSASLRQNRARESRFRRRTIQGVDSSISQAIDPDLRSLVRSNSPSSTVTSSTASVEEKVEGYSSTQGQGLSHSASFSSFSSRSDTYTPRKRTVELYPEDVIPVLGLEDEKIVFIDNEGHCRWLNKHNQIAVCSRAKTPLPEIVMKSRSRQISANPGESNSYVSEMEADPNIRYTKLKQLIKCAKLKESEADNSDTTDSVQELSLFELYNRGDFLEKEEEEEDIDEKYKTISLYTSPRDKPDLESFLASQVIVPIYEGIPEEQLPPEIRAKLEPDESEKEGTGSVTATFINQYALARMGGITQSDGVTTRYDGGRRAARQQGFYTRSNDDGSTTSGYSRSDVDQAYLTERSDDGQGNTSSRLYAAESRSQESATLVNDRVSSILRQRAESRRQQYMSQSQNGDSLQRRAEARRQQYLTQSQTNSDGNTVVQSASESNLEQYSSETRSSDGQHQVYTTHRQESSSYSQTSTTGLQMPGVADSSNSDGGVNLVMERLFLMQGDDGPIDTSHLDYEEMRMIQKALEDNPSPPPSPLPQVEYEYNEANLNYGQQVVDPITTITTVPTYLPSSDRGLDSILEHVEGPNGTRRSESEFSLGAVENDNVITSETFDENTKTETNVVQTITESVEAPVESSTVTSEPNDVSTSVSDTQTDSVVSSTSASNTFVTAKETVLTHTRSVDDVIESRMPRYQRLPAADNSDSKLPLPSMDWSPLDRANSPLSPKRFSFEEKRSDGSSVSASNTESQSTSRSTISKSSLPPLPVKRPSVQSELTIDIPDTKSGTPSISRSESSTSEKENIKPTASTGPSPVIRSRNSSRAGSEAPSPAGSETVTTVFEEFVQNIPRELIEKWNSQHNDDDFDDS